MKVRQLLRPTYTYSKFIDESHKPCCERTKENREALFDILRENFKSDAKYGTTRLEYEISEMKRGNIPIFIANSARMIYLQTVELFVRDITNSLLKRLFWKSYFILTKQPLNIKSV
ncbi:MAG: DUF4135 domain-containing protein [Faecalibacterium sp.]